VELNDVHGLRFNVWTSIVLFVVAAIYFVVSLWLRPGQEESVYDEGRGPQPVPAPAAEDAPAEVPEPDADVAEGAAHDPETQSGPPASP